MPKIKRPKELPLSLAVWLMHDEYDYINEPNYVSATSLLDSTRKIILKKRVDTTEMEIDLLGNYSSRLGTAVHDSIEKAWKSEKLSIYLMQLGYPENVAKRMVVNPTPEEKDIIPVYQEIRTIKDFLGYRVGGKFDFGLDGIPEDFKTMRVYAFNDPAKLKKHTMQLGIYRWLNPEIFLSEIGRITEIYTDWTRPDQFRDDRPNYWFHERLVTLPTKEEVEMFIEGKLSELSTYMDAPENEIPRCSKEDLWQDDTIYKYYKDPNKTEGRSTKNCTSLAEAELYKQEKGKGVGTIIEVQGKAKACNYCEAFSVCKQKDGLIASGLLETF